MVEVGGSNPPGPTKRETLAIGGGFSFVGLGWTRTTTAVRSKATKGAFDTERRRREARRDETGPSLFQVIRLVLPNVKPSP